MRWTRQNFPVWSLLNCFLYTLYMFVLFQALLPAFLTFLTEPVSYKFLTKHVTQFLKESPRKPKYCRQVLFTSIALSPSNLRCHSNKQHRGSKSQVIIYRGAKFGGEKYAKRNKFKNKITFSPRSRVRYGEYFKEQKEKCYVI